MEEKGRKRLPLSANRRRLSYERRICAWLWSLGLLGSACAGWIGWTEARSSAFAMVAAAVTAVVFLLALSHLFKEITRPLQTLSNVVAALRDEDFSLRARGGRRGDSLGDLALEVNALAGSLQAQRGAARDALSLAERVMSAMQTPVLAFAADGRLRLVNPAAERSFGVSSAATLRGDPEQDGLGRLLSLADGAVYVHLPAAGVRSETRWVVRWSEFRLGGIPHRLAVLTDVDAVLREEERGAWQRLVRVLSHEINNSLTPITTVAGSLRTGLPLAETTLDSKTLRRLGQGLRLIEDRALSLHRFLQAYQQLSRLPRPSLTAVSLHDLVSRVAALECQVAVGVPGGPAVTVQLDVAQIEQLLINLLRNAAEAALAAGDPGRAPEVLLDWETTESELRLRITDNGAGLSESANLFVPFYTTKPGGSGIGLVLAQQIAQAHGGELTLRNRLDSMGCVAELRLPLRTDRNTTNLQLPAL